MSNLFLPACVKSCVNSTKQDNCFITINDPLSDDEISQIIEITTDPVKKQKQKEILDKVGIFISDQNLNSGSEQFFNPRKLYLPVKGDVKCITDQIDQTIFSYIDTYWKNYENSWNYTQGMRVVGSSGMLFLSLWSNVHILENYDVSVRKIDNSSFDYTITNNEILFIYPDISVNAEYLYQVNNTPESGISQLEYTGSSININTSYTVFLVRLTPKL